MFKHYKINAHYFDKINTEEKAYWLGFIAADGCIGARHNLLRIVLQHSDIKHLKKFRTAIKSTHPIKILHPVNFFDKTKFLKHAGITIYNLELKTSLIKLGLTPLKAYRFQVPRIRKNLQRHFWRGMIDGDGCLSKIWQRFPKYKKVYWVISLQGNAKLLTQFKKFVTTICDTKASIRKEHHTKTLYVFAVGGKRGVLALAKKLYSKSKVNLSRKYHKYLELVKDLQNS